VSLQNLLLRRVTGKGIRHGGFSQRRVGFLFATNTNSCRYIPVSRSGTSYQCTKPMEVELAFGRSHGYHASRGCDRATCALRQRLMISTARFKYTPPTLTPHSSMNRRSFSPKALLCLWRYLSTSDIGVLGHGGGGLKNHLSITAAAFLSRTSE
jgi:hypothetical protein